jgi:carbon storage regulator
MLVLSRKQHESVMIGLEVEVIVLEVSGDRVKLGFRAPPEVTIHRREVYEQIVVRPPALEEAECA